jgi:hypothetical protein
LITKKFVEKRIGILPGHSANSVKFIVEKVCEYKSTIDALTEIRESFLKRHSQSEVKNLVRLIDISQPQSTHRSRTKQRVSFKQKMEMLKYLGAIALKFQYLQRPMNWSITDLSALTKKHYRKGRGIRSGRQP